MIREYILYNLYRVQSYWISLAGGGGEMESRNTIPRNNLSTNRTMSFFLSQILEDTYLDPYVE